MRGLDPRIHLFFASTLSKKMDCRVKPGNDAQTKTPTEDCSQ
jgi:hypothetical protein